MGRLPQRAGLPGLNDSVTATAVPPNGELSSILEHIIAMGGRGCQGGYNSSTGICQLDEQRDTTFNPRQLTQKAPNSL